MMTTSRAAAGAGVLALALTVAGCGGGTGADRAGAEPTPASHTPGGTHATHSSHGGPTSTTSASANGTPANGSLAPATDTGSARPSMSPGAEVQPPPDPSPVRLPGLRPPQVHTALVQAPLPQQASAVGRLVRGYPLGVFPLAPGSHTVVSGVAPSGNRLQVSLTARTAMRSSRLQLFYRKRLARVGLREVSAPTVGSTLTLGFTRGDNHVVLTISRGAVTRYTLYATLSTAG